MYVNDYNNAFYGAWGGGLSSYKDISVNLVICEVIEGICMIAVNCFILISGYWGSDATFQWKKVFKLALQIWVYSVLIYFALFITGVVKFEFKDFIYAIFPISTNMDAFSTEYLMMYILSPFINILLKNLNKKQFENLLLILVAFFVLWPDLFSFMGTTIEFGGAYGIVWFLVLYITGSYIKKYPHDEISIRKRFKFYCFTGLLIPLSCIVAIVLYNITGITKFWDFKQLFYHYNSVLVYPASIAFFGFMLKVNIKSLSINKVIQYFAPTTFGVYLIHDNRFLRKVIWEALSPVQFSTSHILILYWIICVVGIFVVCAMIEKGRNYIMQGIIK